MISSPTSATSNSYLPTGPPLPSPHLITPSNFKLVRAPQSTPSKRCSSTTDRIRSEFPAQHSLPAPRSDPPSIVPERHWRPRKRIINGKGEGEGEGEVYTQCPPTASSSLPGITVARRYAALCCIVLRRTRLVLPLPHSRARVVLLSLLLLLLQADP
jgi:hypothetical protein